MGTSFRVDTEGGKVNLNSGVTKFSVVVVVIAGVGGEIEVEGRNDFLFVNFFSSSLTGGEITRDVERDDDKHGDEGGDDVDGGEEFSFAR